MYYEPITTPCQLSTYAPNSDGYAHIEKLVNGRRKSIKHHRLVYAAFHRMGIEEMKNFVVMHKCDNRLCINPEHLMLGTVAMNNKDKLAKGKNIGFALGNKVGATKMTAEKANELRAEVNASHKTLAEKYGISVGLVSMIINGKRWK